MKLIIFSVTLMLFSSPTFSVTYDCGDRGEKIVKTGLFSGKVTSVDGIKVKEFSAYVSAEEKYGRLKDLFESIYSNRSIVTEAYKGDYKVIGDRRETAYSRGFFKQDELAYVIRVWRPSPWCLWDACSTHYEIIQCSRIF